MAQWSLCWPFHVCVRHDCAAAALPGSNVDVHKSLELLCHVGEALLLCLEQQAQKLQETMETVKSSGTKWNKACVL